MEQDRAMFTTADW